MIDSAPEVPKNKSERPPLNPERASMVAKEFAEQEERLAELIKVQLDGKGSVVLENRAFFSGYEKGRQFSVSCFNEHIGQGYVDFGFFPVGEPYHLAVGVETDYRLSVGVHTDEATMKQYSDEEKRQGGRAKGQINTMYYFNRDGRYGKVSVFPEYIEDSRHNLMPRSRLDRDPNPSKFVVSEMTIGDFETAGTALALLMKRFAPPTDVGDQNSSSK